MATRTLPKPFTTKTNPDGYELIITDVQIDATIDRIQVKLSFGTHEDEEWTDDHTLEILHPAFEEWCEENEKLIIDDSHHMSDHDGNDTEIGAPFAINYFDFVMNLSPETMLDFLIEKELIPSYECV